MTIIIFILSLIILICNIVFGISNKSYEPNWKSLDKRPLPSWYDEAKIGIFIHWGVYSVPSVGNEWFWSYWKVKKNKDYVDFMKKNYKPGFTYQDFAKDFTAELFNSSKWASLFQDSGAKYVVLTSKHHDGYTLWPSTRSFSWNAMDVGPKRDIIRELSNSIRSNTTLKFGLYYSLFEWFNRMYLDDKSHSFKTNNYVQNKVLPELHELVELYKPDILWSDGAWEALPSYWNSTEFIAWLYNNSPVHETIVTNDRWGNGTRCKHGDFYTCSDRYNPGVLKKHKWENAFTLDSNSWGYRPDIDLSQYMTSKKLIEELVTTISCNGNILVNVGPTRFGTIEPIFEERLRDMGTWLKNNGEAIYSSKPWTYQNDSQTAGVWYTQKPGDDKGRINVYAIILNYPYGRNGINLYSLGGKIDDRATIEFLGLKNIKIKWRSSNKVLTVKLPSKNLIDKHELDFAWTLKINIQA